MYDQSDLIPIFQGKNLFPCTFLVKEAQEQWNHPSFPYLVIILEALCALFIDGDFPCGAILYARITLELQKLWIAKS